MTFTPPIYAYKYSCDLHRSKRHFIPSIANVCLILAFLCICSCSSGSAENENASIEFDTCYYIDAINLRIINKGFDDSESTYRRLPKSLADSVRPLLWRYQRHSAGIAVRFATNSATIGVRYQLLEDFDIPNMADTGVKGVDLYAFGTDSIWHYIMTYKPAPDKKRICEGTLLNNADTSLVTEYMVYLPLYDGVEKFEVRISPDAIISKGDSSLIPSGCKKIVYYGTSIIQGGCASRPGMALTNILSRELNREVINLGFSSQGKLDYSVARAMTDINEAGVYIVDPVPNCDAAMCDTLTLGFIHILKKTRPEVPIVMVGGPMQPHSKYNNKFCDILQAKNKNYRNSFDKLNMEYKNSLYYVDSEIFDSIVEEGTVDGIHLTDYGFRKYADVMKPLLQILIYD